MQVFEVFGDLVFRDNNVGQRLTQIHGLVERARTNFSGLGQNMQMLGGGMVNFGNNIMNSVTKPIMSLIPQGIEYNMLLEEQMTSFEVMLGSAAKAKKFVGEITKMAAETPFESTDLSEVSKTLLGFGVNSEKVLPLMSKLGDVSMGNQQKFKSLGLVMGQVSAAGKLQGGDLLQMINAGWNPLQEMVKMTGKDYKYFREQMEKGNISFDQVSKALDHATQKGGLFYQGMIKGSQTLGGRLSTLKDNFNTVLGKATKPLFDFVSAKVIPIVSDFIAGFDKLSPSIKSVIFVVAGLMAGIAPLLIIVGTLIAGIGGLVGVIGTISAPVVAVVAGLAWFAVQNGILLGSIVALLAKTGILKAIFDRLIATIRIISSVMSGDFNKAIKILQDKFGISGERAKWFRKIFVDVKNTTDKLISTIKGFIKVMDGIFSGKTQNLVKLLQQKFNFTKKEAVSFAKEVENLRGKFIKIGEKIQVIAANLGGLLVKAITKATKFLIDHRKEVMMVISALIKITSKVMDFVTAILKAGNAIGKFTLNAGKAIKNFVSASIKAFSLLASSIGKVISKITGIKFPSPPSWLPGFAEGVRNFGGGYAVVGEKGAEIVKLPRGSDVIPNDKVKEFAKDIKPNLMTKSDSRTYQSIVFNNVIHKDVDTNKMFRQLEKILKARGVSYRNA